MTSRTSLDWLVYSSVWERLREHVQDRYGEINVHLSRTVEQAMRERLDEHRFTDVEDKTLALLDAVGAKKTGRDSSSVFDPQDYSSKTRATVYVDEDLLSRYKSHVSQSGSYSYGVALSRDLEYYLERGLSGRLADQLDRILEEVELDDDMTTTERLADRLGNSFTKAEFLDAAEAEGIGTESYALEEYLPKVLEETDTLPHPNAPEQFIPADAGEIPDTPDPSRLPYEAMDTADKQLAIKAEALRRLADSRGQMGLRFDASDAVDALGGRPRQKTVRSLMQRIAGAASGDGVTYDHEREELRLDQEAILAAADEHSEAIAIAGLDESADGADDSADWAHEAADAVAELDPAGDVPELVLDNKIAKAKHPDPLDNAGRATDDALDSVTPEDRRRVRDILEKTTADDVAEQFAQLEQAQPAHAVADGGVSTSTESTD